MQGINITSKAATRVNAQDKLELKNTLKDISFQFLTLLSKNKMLAVEMLFEFPSKEVKDDILNNY